MVFTQKDAERVFHQLAADERIPHILDDLCDERRELMIGIMLDEMHIPANQIGRITCIPSPGDAVFVVHPQRALENYKDKRWVNSRIKAYQEKGYHPDDVEWMHHTAPTLKCYSKFLGEEVEFVLDPQINPMRMLTVGEFKNALKHRTNQREIEMHKDALGGGEMEHDFPTPDWTEKTAAQIAYRKNELIELFSPVVEALRSKNLIGQAYVDKFTAMDDWSKTPGM